jgi:hypothetical protein
LIWERFAPGRLHDVSNAADFVALTETNFEILTAEVFKQEPTYVSGVPTTTIGPPTTGSHVLNEALEGCPGRVVALHRGGDAGHLAPGPARGRDSGSVERNDPGGVHDRAVPTELPTIVGNVDYQTLRQRLDQIDALLREGGVERVFVEQSLEKWVGAADREPTAGEQLKHQERSRRALRCTILRTLLQEDYRGFSCQLAGNPLYQWFCRIDALEQVRVPSKSELQRFAHWLPAAQMRTLLDGLLRTALEHPRQLGLKASLDLESCFLDTSCLKANIHFPTDWVLLRDGVRTLMKATRLIRKAGLRGRMEAPEVFLSRMNRLSMDMSQQARRAGTRKGRKRVLRQIKRLVGVVQAHARRHRELLDRHWERTEWTRPQAEGVLRRIDGVLDLLPRARKQAHERIIGGRQVANADKILSLYDRTCA